MCAYMCNCGCCACNGVFIYSIEEDFVTWKEKLWPTVCNYFGLDMNAIGRSVKIPLAPYNHIV